MEYPLSNVTKEGQYTTNRHCSFAVKYADTTKINFKTAPQCQRCTILETCFSPTTLQSEETKLEGYICIPPTPTKKKGGGGR